MGVASQEYLDDLYEQVISVKRNVALVVSVRTAWGPREQRCA